MEHIYIYDRESRLPVVEILNENDLFQIKNLTGIGKFEEEYFVMKSKESYRPEDWLGYYPEDWHIYTVTEDVPSEIGME